MILILKNKNKIFTLFNLVLFISSLLFSTISSFSARDIQTTISQAEHEINAPQAGEDSGCSQLVCEKIENETEHDLHVQALVLPFSITYFDLETPQFLRVSAQPIADKLSTPIYISVGNFRI